MIDLKSYFHDKYQGGENFIKNVILPIFGEDKYEDTYEEDVLENNPELITMADAIGISQILRLGTIDIPMNPTDVFDITVSNHVQMERNRVAIQQLVRRIMSTYSSAFMVFHYDDNIRWDWRFTFCSKQGSNHESTDSKRYTFLLGPNQSCRTAAENFKKLADKCGEIELDDIIKAFDVESLSKEFFNKYKAHYEKFCNYLYENRNDESRFGRYFAECKEKEIRDYVKKLLGRLVFLQFLQKKGWLGVPDGRSWGEGDLDFLQNLFKKASPEQQADFLDEILEPLFQRALDTNRLATCQLFDTQVEEFRSCKIPYLNGGLFSKDGEIDDEKSVFPANYFRDLLDFFYQYNFTIDENDPNDAAVGIDPEMLGRIFENLLEDNKDKGAFYTPKEIVQYMCRESLIAYLQTDVKAESFKERIRTFVTHYEADTLTEMQKHVIVKKLKEVKICDPAIGSGAFPMGLLRELFNCRSVLEDFSETSAAEIKKDIIQNSIYGVDIEKGAVDIARLRFWLTLILDEETPNALPNLDFKIVRGNSLLESFHGVDLSSIAFGKKKATDKGLRINAKTLQSSILFQDEEVALDKIQKHIRQYYTTTDHSNRQYLLAAIENAVRQFLIHKTEGNAEVQDEIENLPLFNDQFFLWHTFFADVFEKGGFDIVIGNPPYIQLQANEGYLSSIYSDKGFETFDSTGDIFSLFYEQGWRLLRTKGCLCYITSNKWMRNNSGEKTRKFFAERTNPLLLINFEDIQLFENATVETNILLFTNDGNNQTTTAVVTDSKANGILKTLKEYVASHSVCMGFTTTDSWVVLSKEEDAIKRKIQERSSLLKDRQVEINFGIKTGYNAAFLIDGATRSLILSECIDNEERVATEEIIKPVLRGRDIKRYQAQWADHWLINTHNGIPNKLDPINIDKYPALKNYLLMHWERINKRSDKGRTPFNLRNCAYVLDFAKPKIVWGEISDRSKFCYDEEGRYFCEATTFFMTGEISSFLLCYLNSKLAEYLFSKIATTTGMGTVRWKKYKIEQLLVPHISKDLEQRVDALYRKYLSSKNQNFLIEIDYLIYDHYGLTEEEIAIVEGTKN